MGDTYESSCNSSTRFQWEALIRQFKQGNICIYSNKKNIMFHLKTFEEQVTNSSMKIQSQTFSKKLPMTVLLGTSTDGPIP